MRLVSTDQAGQLRKTARDFVARGTTAMFWVPRHQLAAGGVLGDDSAVTVKCLQIAAVHAPRVTTVRQAQSVGQQWRATPASTARQERHCVCLVPLVASATHLLRRRLTVAVRVQQAMHAHWAR